MHVSPRWRWFAAAIAITTVSAVGLGLTAPTATADTSQTNANARFVSGSLPALSQLTAIPGFGGALAKNLNLSELVRDHQPIANLPVADLLTLGAGNQVAVADLNGVARAMSGAISDGSGTYPSDMKLSLDSLLGSVAPLKQALSALSLQLGALSSAVGVDANSTSEVAPSCTDLAAPVQCRDYDIAGGSLRLAVPGLKDLGPTLTTIVGPLTSAVNGLAGPNGGLAKALTGVKAITDLVPVADLDVTATVNADLAGPVDSVLSEPLADNVVRIDLKTGEVVVDLNALLHEVTGHALNDQAPNTEILSTPVLTELVSRITALVNGLPQLLLNRVQAALDAARVHLSVNVCVLGTGDAPKCPLLLNGLPLGSGLDLEINGTLKEVLSKSATTRLNAQLLGAVVPIPAGDVLGALVPAVQTVVDQASTVTAPVQGALTPLLAQLSPALNAINSLVSLVVNVQETGQLEGLTSWRASALRLTLLQGLSSAGVSSPNVTLATSEVSARMIPAGTPDTPAETPTGTPDDAPKPNTPESVPPPDAPTPYSPVPPGDAGLPVVPTRIPSGD